MPYESISRRYSLSFLEGVVYRLRLNLGVALSLSLELVSNQITNDRMHLQMVQELTVLILPR